LTGNAIIDATDVGIVLFGGNGSSAINNNVSSNQFLQGGNSAFAAVDFDPFTCGSPPCNGVFSYSGTSVASNTLWTSRGAHYHIDFSLGTRAWFGLSGNIAANGTVQNNTVPSGRITRTGFGASVDAMTNASVSGNTLNVSLFSNWVGCGLTANAYTLDPADSSGSVSPAPTSEALHTPSCKEIGAKTIKQTQETLY